MNSYKSIHQLARDEVIINKSKFIGTSSPVFSEEEALFFIEKTKKEFSDATHNVFAFSVGLKNPLLRYSDDHEPSGTAGLPILNILREERLSNLAVVVTRYFGGTLLGTGGLARAYTSAAKISLEKSLIVEKNLYCNVSFKLDYTLLGKMENEINKENLLIKNKCYEEQVIYELLIEKEKISKLDFIVKELTNGKTIIKIESESFYSVVNGKLLSK